MIPSGLIGAHEMSIEVYRYKRREVRPMIKHFADNRASLATKRDRIAQVATDAHARVAAAPVFADISRFGEPSATAMVWQPTTTGFHPSLV